VLRCRQQRLLRRVGTKRSQAVGSAAAATKTSHRLHELANVTGVTSRRIGGETAKLPVQAHLTQAGGADELIASDVVDLECAGVDVAQHEIGRTGGMDRCDARESGLGTRLVRRAGCTVVPIPADLSEG
jgi:hypothetical protein